MISLNVTEDALPSVSSMCYPRNVQPRFFNGEAPCQEVDHFYCLHSLLTIASGIFPTCLIFVICFLIFIY